LTSILEGTSRPGHFRGVATIVCKLFHLVRPDQAYFGEKDYQQLQVIRRMVYDLRMPIEVVGCPTIREPDGLAMSSRNVYLQSTERQAAVVLSQALSRAIQLYEGGVQESVQLQMEVQKMLDQQPLIRTDYVAVVHPQTLQPVVSVATAGAVICLAVWIGQTRLIDNARIFTGDG
jgi:pantoate--beta-alanine ligase